MKGSPWMRAVQKATHLDGTKMLTLEQQQVDHLSCLTRRKRKWSLSVVSNSERPHGLWPTRLLHPWDFPGKSTGVGCHFFLQYCLTGRKDFSVFRDSGDDSEKVQVQRKWCKFLMRQLIPGKTKNWIREELVVVARDWGVGKTGSYWSMSKMSKS